ncbi:MAG: phage tail tape measure protein [Dehalococcoidia bacterium]
MALTLQELQIILTAKDNASAELSKAEKKSDDLDKKLTKMSLAATAGFALLGGAAVKFASDFEFRLDQVGAVANASEKDREALRETALKLGAETAFSAGEAAAAMEELAAGGRSVAQIVGGEATAAVNLAAAGNHDLADSARIIAQAQDIWKDSTLDNVDVVNRLAGAANASRFGVADMGQAISQAGGVAAQMGVDFGEMTTAVVATASAFASGSDAGTSFKTFLLGLDGTTDKAKETIAEYGLEFRTATGELRPMAEIAEELRVKVGSLGEAQQVAALKTIFGNDAYRTAAGLMGLTKDEFVALDAQMRDTSAADVAAQRMGNLQGTTEELMGSLETLGIEIGSRAIPVMTGLAGGATEAVNAFGALPQSTQNIALLGTALAAAAPLIVTGFEKGARAVDNFGDIVSTTRGKLALTTVGIGVAVLGVDALSQALSGKSIFDLMFGGDGDERAERVAEALEEYNDELRGLGGSADGAALATDKVREAQEALLAVVQEQGTRGFPDLNAALEHWLDVAGHGNSASRRTCGRPSGLRWRTPSTDSSPTPKRTLRASATPSAPSSPRRTRRSRSGRSGSIRWSRTRGTSRAISPPFGPR